MSFASVNGRVAFFVEPLTYANFPFEALRRYVPELDHVSCAMLCGDDPMTKECSMRVTQRPDETWLVEQGSFVTEWRGSDDEAWCSCRIFDLDAPDGGVFKVQWCGPADLFTAERAAGFPGLVASLPFAPTEKGSLPPAYTICAYWSHPDEVADRSAACDMMVAKLDETRTHVMLRDHGLKRRREEDVVAASPARLVRTDTQAVLEPAIDEETREQVRILEWMNEE